MQTARTDDALSSIRARLAQLEARADARRTRDAEMDATPDAPVSSPRVHANDIRDNGASWKATQGRDWLAEAVADLARVDAAPKAKPRRNRPETAPEYVVEESAAPVSTVGGHSDATGTQPAADGVGAPAGTPEGSPEPEPVKAAARVVKLPQASARGDWRARWDRINTNVMQAFLTMAAPIRGPFDGLDLRAGAGPPGGGLAAFVNFHAGPTFFTLPYTSHRGSKCCPSSGSRQKAERTSSALLARPRSTRTERSTFSSTATQTRMRIGLQSPVSPSTT